MGSWGIGSFSSNLEKSIAFGIGSGLTLGWRWLVTLCGFGVGNGLVGFGVRGVCCCCVTRCLLLRSKPQLGQRPDDWSILMPHCGQLCWCLLVVSILDGCGTAACVMGFGLGALGIGVRGCVEPVDVIDCAAPLGFSAVQRKPHLGQSLDLLGSGLRQWGHNIVPQLWQSSWPGDICDWQTEQRVILGCTLLPFSDYFAAS